MGINLYYTHKLMPFAGFAASAAAGSNGQDMKRMCVCCAVKRNFVWTSLGSDEFCNNKILILVHQLQH